MEARQLTNQSSKPKRVNGEKGGKIRASVTTVSLLIVIVLMAISTASK